MKTNERLPLEKEQFIENFNKAHALTCNIIGEYVYFSVLLMLIYWNEIIIGFFTSTYSKTVALNILLDAWTMAALISQLISVLCYKYIFHLFISHDFCLNSRQYSIYYHIAYAISLLHKYYVFHLANITASGIKLHDTN